MKKDQVVSEIIFIWFYLATGDKIQFGLNGLFCMGDMLLGIPLNVKKIHYREFWDSSDRPSCRNQ